MGLRRCSVRALASSCSCSALAKPTSARSRRWCRRYPTAPPLIWCPTTWRRYSSRSPPSPTRSPSRASRQSTMAPGRAGHCARLRGMYTRRWCCTRGARSTCRPRSSATLRSGCAGCPRRTCSRSRIASSALAASATRTERTLSTRRRSRSPTSSGSSRSHDTSAPRRARRRSTARV